MRMVFVHGIEQQGKSAAAIRDEWLESLNLSYRSLPLNPLACLTRIDAAFYGDFLEESSSLWLPGAAIPLGELGVQEGLMEPPDEVLRDFASKFGISEAQVISEGMRIATPQGHGVHKGWVKALARLIEQVSPFRGVIALRAIVQAHAYIRNRYVHDGVNDLVRPVFDSDEPLVVISHSLGTVVSYSLLREFALAGRPRQVPLFLTLGSPLGIESVLSGFERPRTCPKGVARWVNGADPEDFVALRGDLTSEMYGPGIENLPDIDNGEEDPHSIIRYLRDARVARIIAGAVST
jgi:hypothetical protein